MPLDQFRLDGKVALVTGASRGIGLAIARLFVEAGAKCLVTGRTRTPEVGALEDANPETVAWVAADVNDPATPDRLVKATLDRFGRLDILVNNAGVAASGPFHEFDDTRLAFIMDTNLIAPFRIARAAVRPMLAQGAGVVLNVGSISAYVANKPQDQVAYNASKAAVHQMTRVMGFEYGPRNIRVN
ncbi:MAG: SDR family NAD(P)-dependent oxidoreductase, partial [Planctomycetes bacterium]|nr:SDR family NAD(P)-dependent oxidoreductase [Planctomycetota bacterium]